jgi:hypothetical protein
MKEQDKNKESEIIEHDIENSTEKKPNEQAGFFFSGSLKITDPNSEQVLLQIRCD